MNENQLSKRLERVGEYIPIGSRLADIGSDHAYLPVALLLQNKIEFAVAGEVVKGPYESAEKQVRKSNLQNKIIVRLADGLAAIEAADQINAISICGMGGTLIRDILENGKRNARLSGEETLILQPNIGEKTLRSWLLNNQYTIFTEDILEENQKIYEIICARKEEEPVEYSERELMFGPLLLQKKDLTFQKKWQRELQQRKRVLEQLRQSKLDQTKKIQEILEEIQEIEEVTGSES